jgi:transcriptional regulator with XRE-family HTH domain
MATPKTHRSLLAMLRKARKDKEVTLADLNGRMRTKLSIVSLSRKLAGKQPSTIGELAKIAAALGVSVEITPESISVQTPIATETQAAA